MVLAFTSQKGGCGKSTLAAHAYGWAIKEGINACLIDMDDQGSSSSWIDGVDASAENYHIPNAKTAGDAISELSAKHDLVIVDNGGMLNAASKAAMLLADVVCIPTRPSRLDHGATIETLKLLTQAAKTRSGAFDVYVIPSMIRSNETSAHHLEAQMEQDGIPLGPAISQRASFAKAANAFNFVWDQGDAQATAEIEILLQTLWQKHSQKH